MSTANLLGKTALVIGAGSGIGRHIAQTLAAQGAYIVLAGRQLATLQQTMSEIQKTQGHCLPVVVDVTDQPSVEALFDQVQQWRGKLDIAVNAAGIFRMGAVDEASVTDVQSVFATNTVGVWLCMKYQIQTMKRQGGAGVIINIASNIGWHLSRPGMAAYAASKAAVVALTKTAALEGVSHGIRINSISPGPVDTRMSYRDGEDQQARDARIAASNPSKRVANLNEISSAVLWLCSDNAAYMVGHDLVIDGGASL